MDTKDPTTTGPGEPQAASAQSPPPPPPLPPSKQSKPSSIAYKIKDTPQGAALSTSSRLSRDRPPPQAGLYFFYGTLQSRSILRDILDLPTTPSLQNASIEGYQLKLWGQYPALIKAPAGVVSGMAFEVTRAEAAAKLAYYETDSYCPVKCDIRIKDGKDESRVVDGFTFLFCGNVNDLDDGTFGLQTWLQRMGRES